MARLVAAAVVLYLGLCCALPLALVLPGIVRRASRPLLVGGGIIAAGLAFFVLLHARGIRMPALGSTLAFDGFGPRILTLPPVTPLLWHGWTLITLVGSLACAGLAYLLVAPRPAGTEASRQSVAPAAMLLAFAGIYALPVLGLPIVFDRYLIPLAGCALALICLVTTTSGSTPPQGTVGPLSAAMKEFERAYLLRALDATQGKKAAAARQLGISRKNLWEKLRSHDISQPEAEE